MIHFASAGIFALTISFGSHRVPEVGLPVESPQVAQASERSSVDQHRTSQLVTSPNLMERYEGVYLASQLHPTEMTEELRAALIARLKVENRRLDENLVGKFFFEETETDTAAITGIHRILAQFRDPKLIPDMVDGMGMGTFIRALIGFGVQAVPFVTRTVASAQSSYPKVDDGLRVLRIIVEEKGISSIPPADLKSMRSAANQRLREKQKSFTTIWYGMDLAVLLQDPELKKVLQRIAKDKDYVLQLGVTDLELIAKTQMRAADRLSGIPAAPPPSAFKNEQAP